MSLALLAAVPAAVRRAAAGEFNRFRVAQLQTSGKDVIRPSAAFVLGQEIRFRTAVDVRLDRVIVPLDSSALFDYPFVLWAGDSDFAPFSRREQTNLVRFVEMGGFLLIDGCGEGAGHAAFDARLRAQLRRAFPARPLVRVPDNHVLLRSFYKLSSVAGRRARKPFVEGIFVDDRISVLYCQNDLTGAWSRDGFGNWEFEAVPGGPAQREGAIRLGVNVVAYALLLDYKDEQAHVEHLLKSRRLRPEDVGR